MSSRAGRAWTRDELLIAINLYCKIPFGKIHIRNPEIIDLASKLDRTPGSISYKLANFASIDPSLDRKGAVNVSKLDKKVWNEFFDNWEAMLLESETKLNEMSESSNSQSETMDLIIRDGETQYATVETRINQNIFRKMILSSYDGKCCITGIENTELLVASHIVPWTTDEKNRMNPMNGLCLNALHDRAFDRGLITISPDFKVVTSNRLNHELFQRYSGKRINLPSRFIPDQNFLDFHRTEIFRG